MRVIRTEIYFDEDDVRGYEGNIPRRPPFREEKNPGVGFAWMQGNTIALADIDNIKAFERLPRGRRSEDGLDPDKVGWAIDLFIRDADAREFGRIPSKPDIRNPDLVNYVLDQEIILERSPPFPMPFKLVLDATNSPIWIGTFMGMELGWDHPVLMLITIPGGIIVVSSAVGIGNAMQAGLNKVIKRLFDGNKG